MSSANAAAPRVVLFQAGPVSEALGDVTRQVVAAAGVAIDWVPMPAGMRAVEQGKAPLPPETLSAVTDCGLVLKTLLRTPVGGGYQSPNVQLRKLLGVYAGVRALRSLDGVPSRYRDVDVLLVREMTEDVHAGIEHVIIPGVVQTIKVVTRPKSERVVRHAFELARRLGRKKVTLVHKANIMKLSDGMFRRIGKEIAAEFPDIAYDDIIADNAAMQLVARPERFDILVAGNLFGDLLGDIGAGIIGAPALVSGHNVSDGAHVFEATHHVGLATDDAGRPMATPLTLLMPAIELLRHLGEATAADRVRGAIVDVLQRGATVTPDHGGRASTSEMAAAIIAALAAQ